MALSKWTTKKYGSFLIFFKKLLKKKWILVTGKGGSGKTMTSVSLALALSQKKKRVLFVESSPLAQGAYFFGIKKNETLPIQTEISLSDHLTYINIKPRLCFEEYVTLHLGLGGVYKKLLQHKMVASFLDSLPGLPEMMLLGRMYHALMISRDPYDVVVFDGPAFGHFLSLLTTPDGILESSLSGPLVQEVSRVRSLLSSQDQTGFLVSLMPEPLILLETQEFIEKITSQTSVSFFGAVIQSSKSKEELLNLEHLMTTHPEYEKLFQFLSEKQKIGQHYEKTFVDHVGNHDIHRLNYPMNQIPLNAKEALSWWNV